MTIRLLAQMLTPETKVIIEDSKTGKTQWIGPAKDIIFDYIVKYWDFSHEHVITISDEEV